MPRLTLILALLWAAPGFAGGPAPCEGAVVLIHGWGSNPNSMEALARVLREAGRTPFVPGYAPTEPGQGLEVLAARLADAVDLLLAPCGEAPSFDVVGFSLGGLLARILVSGEGGISPRWRGRVERVVLVASAMAPLGTGLPEWYCQNRPERPWAASACGLARFSPIWSGLGTLPQGVRFWTVGAGGSDGVVLARARKLEGAQGSWTWRGGRLRLHTRLLCNSQVLGQISLLLMDEQWLPERGGARELCRD